MLESGQRVAEIFDDSLKILESLLEKQPGTRSKSEIQMIYSLMCSDSRTLKFYERIGDLDTNDQLGVVLCLLSYASLSSWKTSDRTILSSRNHPRAT